MDQIYVATSIVAKDGKRNRGVFANRDFKVDEIVEISHVIPLSDKDDEIIVDSDLMNYYIFTWDKNRSCIATGFGELYNHSFKNANIHWRDDVEKNEKIFYAIRDISKDEELLFNYNGLNKPEVEHAKIEYDF